MDTTPGRVAVPDEPSFLCGKAGDRSQPADQTVEAAIEYRARRAPPDIVGRVAIEPVLADVEIKRGQVHRAEIVERREHAVEIERLDCIANQLIKLCETVQHSVRVPVSPRHRLSRPSRSRRARPTSN